jgi:uracil-DNA glycosylase family 4
MNNFKINKFDLDSDCLTCPLSNQSLVNIETNCNNLSDVEVLLIAEPPSNNEVKYDTPFHHNCDAGRGFRIAFEHSNLNNLNYCISNVCLCPSLITNKTQPPSKKAIECCAINLDNLIINCNPIIIVGFGRTVRDRLNIRNSKITSDRGKLYKYLNYDVLITISPRYFQMQGGIHSTEGKKFLNDLEIAYTIINNKRNGII